MAQRKNRYKEFESNMTLVLLVDLVLFLLVLLFGGLDITWLKVIFAILCGLLSIGLLGLLYLNQELTRKRSLWITVSAVSIIVCMTVSLILNYP